MRELNADAVYTGMVWMREFSEEEGCVEYIERLVSNMEREASCNGTPDCFEMTFKYPDGFLDWIYAGEPESVEKGLAMAYCIIFGPTGYIDIVYTNKCKAMNKALRRFTDNKVPRVHGLRALQYGTMH
jgi:hypothetical protein